MTDEVFDFIRQLYPGFSVSSTFLVVLMLSLSSSSSSSPSSSLFLLSNHGGCRYKFGIFVFTGIWLVN